MSTLQELYDAAISAIKQHNEVVGSGPGSVSPEDFVESLKKAGYTSVEVLSKLTFEEFAGCLPFVEINGKKQPMMGLAKSIGKAVRVTAKTDESTKTEGDEKPYVGPKKVRQMSLKQLVESADPEDATNEVGKRLAEISKGQAFCVFQSGTRTYNVDVTLKLLQELKQGYPPRQFYEVDGIPQEVCVLGYIPDNYADENPLYPGRLLRPDGTCDQTNRSWAGVEQQVKQFLRVALKVGTIEVDSIEKAHYYMDLVMNPPEGKSVMLYLRGRYQAASVEFDKLAKEGKLPTLKIAMPKVKQPKEGKNSPFDQGKPVQWLAPTPIAVQNYYRTMSFGNKLWHENWENK